MPSPVVASPRRRRVLGVAAAGATLCAFSLLTGCAGFGSSGSGSGISSTKPFELRGATTVPTPGWIKAENSDAPGSVVYLAPAPLLEATDVQRATAQKDAAGRAILVLQFSPAGTARLTAGTRELVGRQLAAVVEGRVTNMAEVQGPMTINTMALTGFKSFDDATRVAHLIATPK